MSRASEIRDWLNGKGAFPGKDIVEMITEFKQRIRAEEREACAKIAEDHARLACHSIAEAIRARGGAQ